MSLPYTCLVIFVGFIILSTAEFPKDPQPCKYGDTDCVMKLINYYLNQKTSGDSSINLVNLEPLKVAKIELKQGEQSPVNIELIFINTSLLGFKKSMVYKVKGFGKDLTHKHEIHLKMDCVTLLGSYTIGGKILILPISGSGASNITMLNVDMGLYFKGTPYEKNGETYMKVTNMRLTSNPERIYYYFSNLFNGDKALGDNMNLFLNENGKEIFDEVRTSITNAFARIFESVISNVLTKYPYDKFFVE